MDGFTFTMTAELGGTISGEHGIGHKRRDYMGLVMSEAHLDMMRKINPTTKVMLR
jgi:glycolate oxidase